MSLVFVGNASYPLIEKLPLNAIPFRSIGIG
eukprot:CAMPEP_0197059878 /NCGR_PEP_ID=MMETSP1384-20130603/121942_1 /TAXON_ID=29189 /ORGANISM="Ammonia sp." /LENGTH=30 /DNA_ID= /DNA_START= /DNA_END= /DNA_ORIENTATION=